MLLFSRKYPYMNIGVNEDKGRARITIGHDDSSIVTELESALALEDILDAVYKHMKGRPYGT